MSILIPLAGLIIFLTQKEKQPKTAKVCGICALITTVIVFIFVILISISITTFTIAQDGTIDDITTSSESILIEKAKEAKEKDIILDAQDTISININSELTNYYTEKYTGNENADISKYIIDALKKSKKELSDKGISLSASGNKVYLSSDKYTVTGTVSDNGTVTWSNIEEK